MLGMIGDDAEWGNIMDNKDNNEFEKFLIEEIRKHNALQEENNTLKEENNDLLKQRNKSLKIQNILLILMAVMFFVFLWFFLGLA